MSIQEISSNFKRLLKESDILGAGILIIVGIGSFLLGKTWESPPPAQIIQRETAAVAQATEPEESAIVEKTEVLPKVEVKAASVVVPVESGYVASKNGTKYHLPWCSGAKRILEENKVWFATKEEAVAAGYAPASNCKGI